MYDARNQRNHPANASQTQDPEQDQEQGPNRRGAPGSPGAPGGSGASPAPAPAVPASQGRGARPMSPSEQVYGTPGAQTAPTPEAGAAHEAGGGGGGGGGAPATGAPAPGAAAGAYDKNALLQAVVNHNLVVAVQMAAANPAQAMTDLRSGSMSGEEWTAGRYVSSVLHAVGSVVGLGGSLHASFFEMVKNGKPYSALTRTRLGTIYHGVGFSDKKKLFEAQYSVSLAGQALAAGGNADFTEQELDVLYEQSRNLPPAHVEGNPNFVQLLRTSGAAAEGSYGGTTINMDAMNNQSRYTEVFRHEVGHAVDDRLAGETQDLRINQAGWTRYAGVDEWITALGGYDTIPADLQATVRAAVQAYFGGGGTFNSPTATFEETLRAQVQAAHPGVAPAPDGSDEVSQTMTTLQGLYATNMLLKSAIASQGNTNYFRFAGWPSNGTAHFFINHWYAAGYSLSNVTHADLVSWGNVAAAFSDKEWFAEIYQTWYANGVGGAHRQFPGYVTDFFTNRVDALGAPAAPGGTATPAPAPSAGAGGAAATAGAPMPDQQLPGMQGSGGGGHPRIPH